MKVLPWNRFYWYAHLPWVGYLKGKEMPGRDGGKTINLKNVEVVQVDADNNLLLVKGPVPGTRGSLLRIIKKKA